MNVTKTFPFNEKLIILLSIGVGGSFLPRQNLLDMKLLAILLLLPAFFFIFVFIFTAPRLQ